MADFAERYRGRFFGVLRWPQYDALMDALRANAVGWFVYHTDEDPPTRPASAEALGALIDRFADKFAAERARDSLGFIYVDDFTAPTFVKVFDPARMGGCGGGGKAKPPEWILSRLPPEPLVPAEERATRKPLFDRLLGNRP